MQTLISRQERGQTIAKNPKAIMRLGERFYKVTSQTGNGMYDVTKANMNRTIG